MTRALRLITPNGQPTNTPGQQRFLEACDRYYKNIDIAQGLLLDAMAQEDAEAAGRAVRSLVEIGRFLVICAREAGV